MKTYIKQLCSLIFFTLLCVTQTIDAKISVSAINSITHRTTRRLVQKLYDCQWIGTYNVRPALIQTLAIIDDSTKTDEQKIKAMNNFKQELYKIVGSTQNLPNWLTFNAIENLHYKHVFCGFSSHELKTIAKWTAAITVVYLGKEYIRTKVNSGINWTTEKAYGPLARYIKNDLPEDVEKVIAKSIKRIATETVNAPNFKENMNKEINTIVTTATKAALTELSSEENQKKHEEHVQRAASAVLAGILSLNSTEEDPVTQDKVDKRLGNISAELRKGFIGRTPEERTEINTDIRTITGGQIWSSLNPMNLWPKRAQAPRTPPVAASDDLD